MTAIVTEHTPEQACKAFLQQRQSLVLSTLNPQGVLETSVAPFVYRDDTIYVYVSDLAQHTHNLRYLSTADASKEHQNRVSLLFLADEADTAQLFARERLSLHCWVQPVLPQASHYADIMSQFTARFGDIVALLQSLDFHLFALTPMQGTYVRGFGQAYQFNALPCQSLQPKGR